MGSELKAGWNEPLALSPVFDPEQRTARHDEEHRVPGEQAHDHLAPERRFAHGPVTACVVASGFQNEAVRNLGTIARPGSSRVTQVWSMSPIQQIWARQRHCVADCPRLPLRMDGVSPIVRGCRSGRMESAL